MQNEWLARLHVRGHRAGQEMRMGAPTNHDTQRRPRWNAQWPQLLDYLTDPKRLIWTSSTPVIQTPAQPGE